MAEGDCSASAWWDRIADIVGCLKRVKNRHRSGRRRGSRQRRWGDAFSAGCPGMEILDAADSWPNRGTHNERLAFAFTMMNDDETVQCQISDAAMDELAEVKGTPSIARRAQKKAAKSERATGRRKAG